MFAYYLTFPNVLRYESKTQVKLDNEMVFNESVVLQDLPHCSIKTAMKHFQASIRCVTFIVYFLVFQLLPVLTAMGV